MAVFPSRLDPANTPWMQTAGLRRILGVIKAGGGEARIVGGAVRDTLLGRPAGEVDLAVNLPPEKVIALLSAASVKTVPTGIDHGTITAVADHIGYEMTTLRRDIETDGRRAKVAFTDDWQEDAARRDFTFNALYADADGAIYDYFEGRSDLAAGHVRFIGDASERIKEDVLRILRFFRFFAWFGKGEADAAGLAACRALASSLPQLSAERVWREIVKLLAADNPATAWKLMQDSGVLAQVLPEADNLARLENLLVAEKKFEMPPSALTRLAALLPKDKKTADAVARRLKLSNREAEKLQILTVLPELLRGKLDPVPFRRAMYEYGADAARDAALLLAAEDRGADLEPALSAAAEWDKPAFPVGGDDIMKLGIPAGPKVGNILRPFEEWLAAQDFRPTREECLAEVKKQIVQL